jgi:hypothetical protein
MSHERVSKISFLLPQRQNEKVSERDKARKGCDDGKGTKIILSSS